jgi:hypothetical protein
MFPKFDKIVLHNYELVDGYYTQGMLRYHRPDCVFITRGEWQDYKNYKWLDEKIQKILNDGKIACLVPGDGFILLNINPELSNVLNQYENDPVYFLTLLDSENQKSYSFQRNIKCKMLEVPWWFLNECLSYYAVVNKDSNSIDQTKISKNFLCMLGRHEPHKFDLGYALRPYGEFGLITVLAGAKDVYPSEILEFAKINYEDPYDNITTEYDITAAQIKKNDVWISCNVENYLQIEKTYSGIPLIVHPETTCGQYFNTEKSLWPLLLGKLMLIYGIPGTMAHMQKFYDVDFSMYADLSFDEPTVEWTEESHRKRLQLLIEKNQNLIIDCTQVYKELKNELEEARWTLGRNLYHFFVNQIEQIQA